MAFTIDARQKIKLQVWCARAADYNAPRGFPGENLLKACVRKSRVARTLVAPELEIIGRKN